MGLVVVQFDMKRAMPNVKKLHYPKPSSSNAIESVFTRKKEHELTL